MTADSQVLSTRAADTAPAVTGSANPTGAQLAASFPPRPAASSWPATEETRSAVLDRVLVHRDAAAVVLHPDAAVGKQGYLNVGGKAGQGLVNRVVHNLIDQVVEAPLAR